VVNTAPCVLPYKAGTSAYMLRAVCSADYPSLKLESARFVLARIWIEECSLCQGWVFVCDYEDVVFQRSPFEGLGPPRGDKLLFVEEMTPQANFGMGRGRDNNYGFTSGGVRNCYGQAASRLIGNTPVLNSGSILGSRASILGFLKRYQQQFESNVPRGPPCDPISIADQAVLNYLYYTGAFNHLAPVATKYGEGPVLTVGLPCTGPPRGHSSSDVVRIQDGWLLNNDGRPANIVHQDKVCWKNVMLPFYYPRFESTTMKQVVYEFHQARKRQKNSESR